MVYKLSKSKVVVATLLLLTATTLNNATLASNSYGPSNHNNTPRWVPAIHNWSSVSMGGGLLMMGLAWHKGNEKHFLYGAIGVSTSIVFSYVTRTKVKLVRKPNNQRSIFYLKESYRAYKGLEHYIAILSGVCLAIYVIFKLLPKAFKKEAYFGLDKHFKLSEEKVKNLEQLLMHFIFFSGVFHFAMEVCVLPFIKAKS